MKSTFHVADQDREVNFPLMSVQIQALWRIVSHDLQIGRALIEQVISGNEMFYLIKSINLVRRLANELTGTTEEQALDQDLKDSNDKEPK